MITSILALQTHRTLDILARIVFLSCSSETLDFGWCCRLKDASFNIHASELECVTLFGKKIFGVAITLTAPTRDSRELPWALGAVIRVLPQTRREGKEAVEKEGGRDQGDATVRQETPMVSSCSLPSLELGENKFMVL